MVKIVRQNFALYLYTMHRGGAAAAGTAYPRHASGVLATESPRRFTTLRKSFLNAIPSPCKRKQKKAGEQVTMQVSTETVTNKQAVPPSFF